MSPKVGKSERLGIKISSELHSYVRTFGLPDFRTIHRIAVFLILN